MTCGKLPFETKREALYWIRTRAYPNKRTGQTPTRSYKCPVCKKWHLTSKPKGKRQ